MYRARRIGRTILYVLVVDLLLFAVVEGGLRVWEAVRPPKEAIFADSRIAECTPGLPDSWEAMDAVTPLKTIKIRVGDDEYEDVMPEDLPEGDKRVFVFGGSVAAGWPLETGSTTFGLLERRLAETAPTRVYAVAYPGEASCKVAADVLEVVDHFTPDLLILISANNELLEWTHPPIVGGATDALLPLRDALAGLRVYRYAVAAMRSAATVLRSRSDRAGGYTTTVDSCFEPDRRIDSGYDLDAWEKTRARFLERHRRNLTVAAEYARARGVPMILATLPIGYLLPPCDRLPQPTSFLDDDAERAAFFAALDQGYRLWIDGDAAAALAAVDRAIARDPRSALARHLRGLCLAKLGRPAEAREAFARARDRTIGYLGGIPSENETIRQIGREQGVPVADLEAAFAHESDRLGYPFNRRLLLDDCHPTRQGSALMADTLYPLARNALDPPAD